MYVESRHYFYPLLIQLTFKKMFHIVPLTLYILITGSYKVKFSTTLKHRKKANKTADRKMKAIRETFQGGDTISNPDWLEVCY